MKTAFSVLVVASMALTCMTVAVDSELVRVLARENIAPPHPMGLLGWYGPVGPDGAEEYYEGVDIVDIDRQITAAHPGLSLFDDSLEFAQNKTSADLEERSLVARAQNCDISRWGLVSLIGIGKGITRLNGIGNCVVQARQCIRTTCEDGEAIAWCNDNNYALSFTCNIIADMAFAAMWQCANWKDVPLPNVISTQRFHDTAGWNVILGRCEFFCSGGCPV